MNKLIVFCIFLLLALVFVIFQWHKEREQNIWFRDMHAMQTTQRELALQQAERDAIERGHKDHEVVQEMKDATSFAATNISFQVVNAEINPNIQVGIGPRLSNVEKQWGISLVNGDRMNLALTNLQFWFKHYPIVTHQGDAWIVTFEDK